jgi:holo-[acyl-carrier protein] synthase
LYPEERDLLRSAKGTNGEYIMEIVGIGTEIVECLRIGRMVEQHGELFLTRIYTAYEIRYCQARRRTTEQFAARWAAKEAVLKALGISWKRGLNWTDIEIRSERGRSAVVLSGAAKDVAQKQRVSDFLLSLAHCRAYATAYVLALRGAPGHSTA